MIEVAGRIGLWAPLAHVVVFAVGTVLFVPGLLFGLAGGVLFGPVWGTVLNLTGATLGATAAFLVARYIAADWVEGKAGGRLERPHAGVEAEGWRFVAFVRLVPLFPFNLLNYALGLTRIPLHHVRFRVTRLHGARHPGLHLAWLCRPRSDRRQRCGHPLRPHCSWSALRSSPSCHGWFVAGQARHFAGSR